MYRVDVILTNDFSEEFMTFSTLPEASVWAKQRFDTYFGSLSAGRSVRINILKVHQVVKGNRIECEYSEVAHMSADIL
jgi:hypothetical protein